MENEKTFKTKTRYCHILPNKIILTRDGIIGNVAKVTVGNNIYRILIIYGGLSIVLYILLLPIIKTERLFQRFCLDQSEFI